MYMVAIAAGTAFLYSVSAPAVSKFLDIVSGTAGPFTPATGDEIRYKAAMNIVYMVFAAIVVICLYIATDDRTVGLARPPRGPHHRVALGFYLRTACVVGTLGSAVFAVAQLTWPPLGEYVGRSNLPPQLWLDLERSLAAGWCEEIIATLLVWWILDRIPASRGRSIADTGWGTAAIIGVHLVYHLSMGIKAVVLILPVYFTVLCWRHARSLPALIIGHTAFDVIVTSIPSATTVRGALISMVVQAVVFFAVGVALDRRWFTTEAPLPPDAPVPPVVHPVDESMRGLLWPRTDVQPAAGPPRWTWWRKVAVWLAILVVGIQFGPAAVAAARNLGRWFTGEPMLRVLSPSPAGLVAQLLWALLVVVILAAVAGPRAAGVRRTGRGEIALAGGYALRGPYLAHVVITTAATCALVFASVRAVPVGGAPPDGWSSWWVVVLRCVNAGVVESVLLLVLPYFLLEQIRTRSGRPVAHTWIGTCLIVALWTFLHDFRGPVMLLPLVPAFYFQVILWRHTKFLPVLVAFHVGWDLVEFLVPWVIPNFLVLTLVKFGLVGAGGAWEIRGARRATAAANLLARPSSVGVGEHTTSMTATVHSALDGLSPHGQPFDVAATGGRNREPTTGIGPE